jgi:hypothetical protein
MVSLIDQEIGHCVPKLNERIKYVIRSEIMYGGKIHIDLYKEDSNIKL